MNEIKKQPRKKKYNMLESWDKCTKVGQAIYPNFDKCTNERYNEIAKELGFNNRKMAHAFALYALGKLAIRAQLAVGKRI